MKKIFLLLTAVLICVVFCGCADFYADFGIDEDCSAYMEYHIKMDLSDVDSEHAQSIIDGLNYFCDCYENNFGFKAKRKFADLTKERSAAVDLTYKVECETREEAFEELKKMLTDPKLTPFVSVEMAADKAEFEEGYSFTAETDLSKILATSGYESFPKDLKEMIAAGIEEAKGSFKITLPATTIVESVGNTELDGNFCTEEIPLSLKEPMKVNLKTRLSLEDGLPAAVSTDESIKQLQSKIALFRGIAIGFSVFALAAATLIIVFKKRQTPCDPDEGEAELFEESSADEEIIPGEDRDSSHWQ